MALGGVDWTDYVVVTHGMAVSCLIAFAQRLPLLVDGEWRRGFLVDGRPLVSGSYRAARRLEYIPTRSAGDLFREVLVRILRILNRHIAIDHFT